MECITIVVASDNVGHMPLSALVIRRSDNGAVLGRHLRAGGFDQAGAGASGREDLREQRSDLDRPLRQVQIARQQGKGKVEIHEAA